VTIEDLLMGTAVLEVEDAAELTPYWCQANMHRGNVVRYGLRKFNSTEVYDLRGFLGSCDCPDGTFRPNRPGRCHDAVASRKTLATCLRVVA
jgi:hypothetical protein